MTSEIAAMLDELMGRNRNSTDTGSKPEMGYRDDDICTFYLCGFCPHELFTNTRADLGPCKNIHDEGIRRDYQVLQPYNLILPDI